MESIYFHQKTLLWHWKTLLPLECDSQWLSPGFWSMRQLSNSCSCHVRPELYSCIYYHFWQVASPSTKRYLSSWSHSLEYTQLVDEYSKKLSLWRIFCSLHHYWIELNQAQNLLHVRQTWWPSKWRKISIFTDLYL